MQRSLRLKRELQLLSSNPPHGISCWQENVNLLKAIIIGNDGTPYAGGMFELDIILSDRYPFEPPKLKFITPIYHPNIDAGGRICLDTLKMPPSESDRGAIRKASNYPDLLPEIPRYCSPLEIFNRDMTLIWNACQDHHKGENALYQGNDRIAQGAWKPSLNISSVLTTIQLLMSEPNPDDPLMADIASEYKFNREVFVLKAKEHTNKHAKPNPKVADVATSTGSNGTASENQQSHKRFITNKENENYESAIKKPRV